MQTISINDFSHWRETARALIVRGVKPRSVLLQSDGQQKSLFNEQASFPDEAGNSSKRTFGVPRNFMKLAEDVAYHRDSARWNLLYRVLWRITHDEPQLLEITTDDDVLKLHAMEKEVRRDAHKMKAFVRFRKVIRDEVEHFIAWYRPDHKIVRKVSPFFSRRFKGMNWTILTPDESAIWDQRELNYGGGVPRSEAPASDELEDMWRTYYGSIFNPARVKIKMMKSEMPVRFWDMLPETELIADLIADAPRRVEKMIEAHEGFAETAQQLIETQKSDQVNLGSLQQLAATCQACDLHQRATQTVFGTGPANSRIVIVGEQPGDEEDLQGEPFFGPAGEILNSALQDAAIDRSSVYVTNIVKHFKHTSDGSSKKKRLHQKPSAREVRCCRPWFDAEWKCLTEARVLVCLGATSAQAIIEPGFRITKQRGKFFETDYCPLTIASWHPSAILRAADVQQRETRMRQLTDDLQQAITAINAE